jgi:arylsulfatase A-like enzyme
MSPLANLVALLIVGGLLVAGWAAARGRVQPRVIIAGVTWVGLFSLTMTTGRFHWVASALVTLGLATQLGRTLSPGGGEVVAWARRSTPWLLALVIGMGLLVPIAESRRERRQLAAAGTPAPDAPNVLFVVLDTERAASTSLHGAVRPTTPFLEELAREGVQFERAIAPTSWTLPSHAAMFTGREVRDLGVDWNSPLDDRYPVLAEVLSEHGYATAGFVANHKFLADLFGLGRGFGVWRDQPIQPGTIISHSWLAHLIVGKSRKFLGNHQMLSRKTADMVNSEFLDWLAIRPDRPFFAFLNYFDAHAPYLPPEPWNLRFAPTQPRYWIEGSSPGDYPPSDLDELRIAYATGIAYLDDRLKALFEALGRRGLLENTLIVITSDHGEDFGEGTQVGHGNDLTMPLVHVPLVIIEPGTVPAGVNVAVPVQLQDLAATILDLTVGEDPAIEGESLASHWRIPVDSLPLHVLYSNDGLVTSVVTDSFQLLHARDGSDRLFNHREDPLGLHDLALDPAHAGTLAEHQRLLQAHLDAQP